MSASFSKFPASRFCVLHTLPDDVNKSANIVSAIAINLAAPNVGEGASCIDVVITIVGKQ